MRVASRFRPRLAAALVAGGLAVAWLTAWWPAPVGPVGEATLVVLHWAGIGVAAFIAIVGVASFAWWRHEADAHREGARWFAAVMLAGTGVGVVVFAVGALAFFTATGRDVTGPVLAVACGAAGALVAWLGLANRGAPLSALGLAAVACVALGGWFLPARFPTALTWGLAFFALVRVFAPRPAADDARS